MKKSKRYVRICAALLCAVLCLSVNVAPAMAAKVTQADIDALKGNAASLDKKQKEIQSKLNSLKNDKAAAVQKKTLLDDQIANTNAKISNTEAQISDYNALISQAETELADAQQREEAQYELFCKRVREMEERGTISYWSVLFKANSFSDLLGSLDFINEVMDYDRRVIQDLQTLQAEIAEKKAGLEANKAALEAAKAELETQKKQLSAQREEANKLVKEIDDNAAEYQATLDELDAAEYQATLKELEAEERRIEQQVKQMQKKLEEQMAAEGKKYNTNPGGYIWPVDSRYITSTVGGRNSPGGVGSTNHKGTDIGRVGYTSPVYAAKAGTVIIAQRSSSYGNYVVISHGVGNTTLYAHMSSIKVSVGTYVKQGQTIGITGSTGHSTGPHLHFEVVENNVRINPLSHGAAPKKGYLTGYTLSGTSVGK